MMYGKQKTPFTLKHDDIEISIEGMGDWYDYTRKCGDEEFSETVFSNNLDIVINPVEPLNLPDAIADKLLIEFDRSIRIEPKLSKKIYITFPIEIGVFISREKQFEKLDVFTKSKQKLTLFGTTKDGLICKYWDSSVHKAIPKVDITKEGVIELTIANVTSRWIEVHQTVLDAYGMKIFFSKELVSMKAGMRVLGELLGETYFVKEPLKPGMWKATELFRPKKVPGLASKFIMESDF